MRRRLVEPLVRLGSLVVALVLAHDLAFLASKQGAYAAALAASGHGAGWTTTVLVVAGLAGLLLAIALARLAVLGHRAHGRGRASSALGQRALDLDERTAAMTVELRAALRGIARNAARLGAVVTLGFVVQENAEHLAAGLPAPGVAILAWDGNLTPLPIIGLTSLAVAAVVGLFDRRHADLLARVGTARDHAFPRAAAGLRHPLPGPMSPAGPGSLIGRRMALRAPPVGAAA